MKKFVLRSVAVLFALLVIGLLVAYAYALRGMDGDIASVKVGSGEVRGAVAVLVVDRNGVPVPDAEVATESGSGTESATTDIDGRAVIRSSETEVIGLYYEGEKIWESPYVGTLLEALLSPSTSRGLRFDVRFTEPLGKLPARGETPIGGRLRM